MVVSNVGNLEIIPIINFRVDDCLNKYSGYK